MSSIVSEITGLLYARGARLARGAHVGVPRSMSWSRLLQLLMAVVALASELGGLLYARGARLAREARVGIRRSALWRRPLPTLGAWAASAFEAGGLLYERGARLARGASAGMPRRAPVSRLLPALAVIVTVAVVIFVAYRLSSATASPQTRSQVVQAQRGALVSTTSAKGAVSSARQVQLTFGTAGRMGALHVSVGQNVKAGQPLASLDANELQARLEQARSDLRIAHLKLERLKAVATPEEIESARAAVTAAESKVQDLKAGVSGLDVQAAEAGVAAAEASLASARAKRSQLTSGPLTVDVIAGEQLVATARADLQKAEADLARLKAGPSDVDLEAAKLEVDRAKQALLAEQISRDAACGRGGDDSPCKAGDARVWAAELSVRQANLRLQQLRAGSRPEDLAAAERSVESARKGLQSAEARLKQLFVGPTEADLQAALSAEKLAEANLRSAQSRLEQLRIGAKASDLQAAQASVASASASLATRTSPRASDLALAEEEVRRAQATVDRAETDLKATVLTAPFDGVVASLNADVGGYVYGNTTAITLVDPKAMRLDATVDDVDVAKFAPGQQADVTLDLLGERRFTGRVISLAPRQQGTSYVVSVEFDPGDAGIASGMMGTISRIVERKDDVLLVPSRAVRRDGREQVVEVLVDGKPQVRKVRTGSSNGQSTEIVEGLAAGDRVLLVR